MVEENKIKRVVSMTGAYVFRNYTVKDIQDLKGLNQLTQTLPFSPHEAGAAEVAGIDMINTRYDFFHPENAINIRNSASKTFMTNASSSAAFAIIKIFSSSGCRSLWFSAIIKPICCSI